MRAMAAVRRRTGVILILALLASAGWLGGGAIRASAAPAQGIDVSDFNGAPDWPKVAASGDSFAYARVAWGTEWMDTAFAANFAGIKRAGMAAGGYLAFNPADDPAQQATIFDQTLLSNGFTNGDLVPAVDVEVAADSPSHLAAELQTVVAVVQEQLGVPPVIYVGAYFWNDNVALPPLAADPLWFACWCDPVAKYLAMVGNWGGNGYSVWQYSDAGTAPTIDGKQVTVDLDVARPDGSLPIMRSLPCPTPTPTATPTPTPTVSPIASPSPTPSPSGCAAGDKPTTFYFAEGFTGPGFQENLYLLMPTHSGIAQITYYTTSGTLSATKALSAGQVGIVDVNAAVGIDQQVSARVVLPASGVVERRIGFAGAWHGSTDVVGTTQAATTWSFAEGSTLPGFSEFLSLQNPSPTPVTATLQYYTDWSGHPVKTLVLPASSRTTVEVFHGAAQDVSGCVPNGAGASCGVGPGIQGVSVRVSATGPIVAERPMYVEGINFGYGPVDDGHDAFGAAAPSTTWSFAEGTTLAGFNEYLTLENPNSSPANVTLHYDLQDIAGGTTRGLTVNPQSRATVPVWGPAPGVGFEEAGVSVQVTSDVPVVAERPMYLVHDFGSGTVSGAHDVLGATSLGTEFGLAAASTQPGDWDYLTVQNPGQTSASVRLTYLGSSVVLRFVSVPPNQRTTVQVWDSNLGMGPGVSSLGIVLVSSQPVLVEKSTYSTNATGGATDTLGYDPPDGF